MSLTTKAPLPYDRPQPTRETVESIIVAFILAFLFRAFVAEAFIIPTGSMATTLMGAHKDLFCSHCGIQYQASASTEFDSDSGALTNSKTIASTCSNCRGLNKYDFRGNPNHATFSGDRILVSKFDYVLHQPQRWDVFVFKYPREARMNYIKRLVGLPGERLLIREGDVYVSDASQSLSQSTWEIARKPPHKIRALRRLVYDTKYVPSDLVEAGWPSLWQPWPPGEDPAGSSWTVEQTSQSWRAELSAADTPSFLRYFHKFLSVSQWEELEANGRLPEVSPYHSRLITDYLAYNSRFTLHPANALFDLRPTGLARFLGRSNGSRRWFLEEDVPEEITAWDAVNQRGLPFDSGYGEQPDGLHWVGDLCAEFHVRVTSETGLLLLDLVEFGVHFQVEIDVASGRARLVALDGDQRLPIFAGAEEVTADTTLRGPGRYRLEFANFDDRLVLWINGNVVQFDRATDYDSHAFRTGDQRRPYWTEQDPLDAAPVGIGGQGLAMELERAVVYRDIYYIAIQPIAGSSRHSALSFTDYNMRTNLGARSDVVLDPLVRTQVRSDAEAVLAVYQHPQWWDRTKLFSLRGESQFELGEHEYFPMGDNSAESSDARAWAGHHYVEEKFVLGKALFIFWPHTWKTPLPYTPNFRRMRLIR